MRAHVLGAGCSDAHVVLEWEGNVFVGDLIGNGTHAWLELGHVDEWQKRLSEIRAMRPTRVHPGRGPSGGPDLLDHEGAYLKSVLEDVSAEQPRAVDDGAGIERAIARIKRRHPTLAYDVFLRIGVPAVWNALARRQGS
jgi:hypothetical protein